MFCSAENYYMRKCCEFMVNAEEISAFIGCKLYGENIEVKYPCSINKIEDFTCVFLKEYKKEYIKALNDHKVFAILPPMYRGIPECSYIISDNPRLLMAKVISRFFVEKKETAIAKTAVISSEVRIGKNVTIGEYCVIEGKVDIGDGTYIGHHVCITGDTIIGKNCHFKSGSVIGEEGFGFERDENSINVRFPQIGRIEIGDNVSIGANSTIERAALEVTKIEDGVAIDDLTQVGHNVTIGKGTTVANGAVLCGGVIVGERCSIAPNACIRQRLKIGNDSLIGLGAVVVKDVPPNSVYAGNPAKQMEKKR